MIRYLTSLLALLGLSYAVLAVVRPEWASKLGLDLWNLPQLERDIASQEEVAARLAGQQVAINERSAGKGRVARELIDERLTLMQAAAYFRQLDDNMPGTAPDHLPGKTEGERYCREVILWAKAETRDWSPDRAAEVVCRLETELEDHLTAHNDVVILPDF
jgi:hypothetical protein